MANITGTRDTLNILQNRRVIDMSKDIASLYPNEAPFVTLLKMIKKNSRVAVSPKFEWLEDTLLGNQTAVNNGAGYDAAATSIVVDDASIFRINDIAKVTPTGENILVTAVDTDTNTLTVSRGFGSTAAADITNDDEVLILGNASTEGSSDRGAKSTQETNAYNYTQIFRTPISLTNTENASELYGGNDRKMQILKASIEHKRDIANAIYFGQRKQVTDATTGRPRRTMGGILEFMAAGSDTCAFDASSNKMTYNNFNKGVAQKLFAHGSNKKLLIAGPKLINAINSWAEKKIVTDVATDTTYGVRVKNLVTSYGDLTVLYDPLLSGATYSAYGFALDMENIRYAFLRGRDTKLYTDIQSNDVDGIVDEYLTECSIEFKQPKTHILITGAYDLAE